MLSKISYYRCQIVNIFISLVGGTTNTYSLSYNFPTEYLSHRSFIKLVLRFCFGKSVWLPSKSSHETQFRYVAFLIVSFVISHCYLLTQAFYQMCSTKHRRRYVVCARKVSEANKTVKCYILYFPLRY